MITLTAFWLSLAVSGPAVEGAGRLPIGVFASNGLISGRCMSRGIYKHKYNNIIIFMPLDYNLVDIYLAGEDLYHVWALKVRASFFSFLLNSLSSLIIQDIINLIGYQ